MLKNLDIRSDSWGDGSFGASRGSRKHEGVDYLVIKGQSIFAPEKIEIIRKAFPYGSDLSWEGLLFKGLDSGLTYKVFYFEPIDSLIGEIVEKGTVIGFAQSINEKYKTDKMKPHIHVEIRKDSLLLNPVEYLKKDAQKKNKDVSFSSCGCCCSLCGSKI